MQRTIGHSAFGMPLYVQKHIEIRKTISNIIRFISHISPIMLLIVFAISHIVFRQTVFVGLDKSIMCLDKSIMCLDIST